MFKKYLRAAAGGESITHQLGSHRHRAPPASEGPVAHTFPLQFVFYHPQVPCPQPPRRAPTDAGGTRRKGEGFGTWGLGELAVRLHVGEGERHPRGTSHKRQLLPRPWGEGRSRGARSPPGRGMPVVLPRGLQVAGRCLVFCPADSPCDALMGQDTARVLQAPEDMGGRRSDVS